MSRNIKNVRDLRAAYDETHPDEPFFDKKTLDFFGEKIGEMRLSEGTVKITDLKRVEHTCYVLTTKQHNTPSGEAGREEYYFDVDTFDLVFKMKNK